ncbi:YfhO family protein [Klebsiella pneumoniae]|nr:YfhO family protein [Klebsiella pneumoniae]
MVISESFLRVWQAKVDGLEATIVRANGLYMAVEIPKGEHRVMLEYNGIIGEAGILKKLGIIKNR